MLSSPLSFNVFVYATGNMDFLHRIAVKEAYRKSTGMDIEVLYVPMYV